MAQNAEEQAGTRQAACVPQVRPFRLTDRPREILDFALQAAASGMGCAFVTLVEIVGGAARALGANMAVRGDGGFCGFVSGGCVEAAVAAEAVAALAAGRDRQVRFGKGSPFFDIVLPCGGGLGLAIHVLRDPAPIAAVLESLSARVPARLLHDPVHETLQMARGAGVTGWSDGVFCTSYRPDLRLFLIGQGLEAQAFARLAQAAGLEIVQGPGDDLAAIPDAHSAVVVLRHDVENEIGLLRRALQSDAFYIGCLGGRATHARRTALLRAAGVAEDQIARIHAPIGLFGPARDAAAIAASVLAEVLMQRDRLALLADRPVGGTERHGR